MKVDKSKVDGSNFGAMNKQCLEGGGIRGEQKKRCGMERQQGNKGKACDDLLRSWALFFIFWPPIYFPRHSLPTNPPYQSPATKSYDPKEYHVSSWIATSPFKLIGYPKIRYPTNRNSIVLFLLFSIFSSDSL